ncbi:hypothetical protein ASD13_05210 [Microbacterium sp. Root1433D1]|uniref:hypothetical protein n=1 Tax=Microbacterium TaxID=33882 RepID=UPI0006FBAF0B|nr:hypothetical protein [Microbacterium sp. Root1433D1]KQY78055.1 hypothetical protein ASD13_05210 [Microbacterium sp. Root1433D1]
MEDCTAVLAETGADGRLLIVGVLLLAAGAVAFFIARRPKRAALMVSGLVLAMVAATGIAAPTVASAADGCSPNVVSAPPAPVTPVAPTPPVEPIPVDPTPVTPACPADGELSSLPAGQSIVWVATHAEDPTAVPGVTFGDTVMVFQDGISGYTWHIASDSGTASPDCGGMPLTNGACTTFPATISYTNYVWQEPGQWAPNGTGGNSDGCIGGGNNNA